LRSEVTAATAKIVSAKDVLPKSNVSIPPVTPPSSPSVISTTPLVPKLVKAEES
jgi:hypothetical protein